MSTKDKHRDMHESTENRIRRLEKQAAQYRTKISALIYRQREILEFLEYSLDQKNARENHLRYTRAIADNSAKILRIHRLIAATEDHIKSLNHEES